MLILSLILNLVCLTFGYLDHFSLRDLQELFGSKNCIQATLSSIQTNYVDNTILNEKESKITTNLLNISTKSLDSSDKSTLSKLNELAQYNELKYYYKLEEEEGPAHNKLFKVSLTLGEEKYFGEGKSLKLAKQNVASLAILNTNYEIPPMKEKSVNTESQTPTVLLNNLCTKWGIKVTYFLMNGDKQDFLSSNSSINEKPKKSYLQKLNESMDESIHVRKDLPQSKGPFKIKVELHDNVFYGVAHSIQAARHEAARSALEFLVKNKDNLNLACNTEDSHECKKSKQNLKSPVSIVYEEAQMRHINIDFEILEESGPAHKKNFVTQCKLGHLTTIGEGKSKKESKRAAAESMIEKMSQLEPIPVDIQAKSLAKDKKKKNKKNKMIKTKFDELSMAAGNLINSVFGSEEYTENKNNDKPTKPSKKPKRKQSFQEEILELTNFLNVEIQYTDFSEKMNHFSLLTLHIYPEYLCFGEGFTENEAREIASHGGLKVLYGMGVYDRFQERNLSPTERDVKIEVENLLAVEIPEEKKS